MPSRRRAAFLLALAACLIACGSPAPRSANAPLVLPPASSALPAAATQTFAESDTEYVFADPDRRKKLVSAFPALDAISETTLRAENLPGFALGVVIDGELAYAKGFGFADIDKKTKADPDTVYCLGSITKSFTGLALLSLRDEGMLSLDDPLARFIPEASGLVYPTRDAPPITLREILLQVSGLPNNGGFDTTRADHGPSEEDVVKSLVSLPIDNAPGTTWAYSNLGYALLGVVVGRASHQSLRAVVSSKILKPLGMASTGWALGDAPRARIATPYMRDESGALKPTHLWNRGAAEGDGGLDSSLRDMARYVAFELAAYPPRSAADAGPVRRSSVREAHFSALKSKPLRIQTRDAQAIGENTITARTRAYGYGWVTDETCEFDRLVQHDGATAGFHAQVSMLPERGVGVVLLRNLFDSEATHPAVLVDKVLAILKKTGGLSKRVVRPKLLPAFDSLMPRLLSLYENWNRDTYQAMLSPRSPLTVNPENERDVLASLKRLHGACKTYTPIENITSTRARFALQCERGALELEVRLDPTDGLLNRHVGALSRDIAPPTELAKMADSLAGLVGKWDDSVFAKHLAAKARRTREETAALFRPLRDGHGTCKVQSFKRSADAEDVSAGVGAWTYRDEFTLTCERGGDLTVELTLDEKNPELVMSYAITSQGGSGTCPVK